jgi:hypothetical protein
MALLSSDVTSETVTAQVKSSRVLELENSDPRKRVQLNQLWKSCRVVPTCLTERAVPGNAFRKVQRRMDHYHVNVVGCDHERDVGCLTANNLGSTREVNLFVLGFMWRIGGELQSPQLSLGNTLSQ